jgi:hypothetical protein
VLGAPAAQAFPAAVTQALPSGAADAAPTRNIQLILDCWLCQPSVDLAHFP